MKDQAHEAKHLAMHRYLNELLADYIAHHPKQKTYLDMPVKDLLRWAYEQAQRPTN